MTEEERFKQNKKELLRIARRLLKENSNGVQHHSPENTLPSIDNNISDFKKFFSN